jgi:hypothetical protein
MLRRVFCKLLLVAVVVFGLLALSGVLFAQGNSNNGLARAIEVQERNTERLMAINGVVGTAVDLNPSGRFAVAVLLERPGIGGIPQQLEGVPVHPLVTGKITALPKSNKGGGHSGGGSGGGSLSPSDKWPTPVPIGVSTGNEGECSAGTISCRVTDGTNVYALSNNHVYALENSAGDKSKVLQPGLYDTNCQKNVSTVIGTLADFVPIDFSGGNNTVDAAIALSSTGVLGNTTPPNGYGTPKSSTTGPSLYLKVQKYGRTTALNKGQVVGLNATINIGYSSGTAVFVNQIIVYSNRGAFIKPGDSGSLLVTDPGRNPVGLLFAGDSSGKYGIANPINEVLGAFGVTIDGQ